MNIQPILESDLDAVAFIHLRAFPDSALTRLGWETVRRYYSWQLKGPHDSLCIGAFDDTTLTGFCFAGIFRGAETGFFRENFFFLSWHLITQPRFLINKKVRTRIMDGLGEIKQLLLKRRKKTTGKTPENEKFGILSIAVDPMQQGTGIGRLLLNKVEQSARDRGFRRMRLSVHPFNQQAISFYEGNGWDKKLPEEGGWQGVMIKCLDDHPE